MNVPPLEIKLIPGQANLLKDFHSTVLAAIAGCVSGETLIDCPNGQHPIKSLLGFNDVLALTGSGIKPVKAFVFRKGINQLYKLSLDNGQSIEATANHYLLVQTGRMLSWVSVGVLLQSLEVWGSVRVLSLPIQVSSPYLRQSRRVSSPPIQSSSVQRWIDIGINYQAHYAGDSCLCGGLSQMAIDTVLSQSPLSAGVLGYNHSGTNTDGRGTSQEYSRPCQSSARHAKSSLIPSRGHDSAALCHALPCTCGWSQGHDLESSQGHRLTCGNQTLDSLAGLFRPVSKSFDVPYIHLQSLLYHNLATIKNIIPTTIASYYDMVVPHWHNYIAHGMIHHNTGGGKTSFGLIWLQSRMEAFPGYGWLVAEPTYQMLAKILLNSPDPDRLDIIKYFERAGHHPDYSAGDKILKTDFGMVYLASADNPDTMQGAAVRGAWLDEGGMMSLQAHEAAFQRRSMMAGQELITTTPYNMGWLKTEIADKAGELIHVEKWASADRPGFPLAEVEKARKLLNPSIFKMRYEAVFERPEGLVYSDFDRSKHIVSVKKDWRRVIAGLDWGFVAPGCILVIAEDNDLKHYIIHEEYLVGVTVDQWAVIAKNLKDQYKIERFYCDPAEPNNIKMFKNSGLAAQAAENAVVPGINKIIEGWRAGTLFILEGVAPHLIDELESYHWNDKVIKDAPVKENDHAADALRYSIMGLTIETGIAFGFA